MSHLGQFLKEKKEGLEPNRSLQEVLDRWKPTVERLLARIRRVLEPYQGELTFEEWLPLLQEGGVRYNVPALTITFVDYQITVHPKKAPTTGPGRVEMSCGASVVWLIWSRADEWSYKWEYPLHAEGPQPLTDAAIEQLVEELLT